MSADLLFVIYLVGLIAVALSPLNHHRWIETDRGPARCPNCGPAGVGS